MRSRGRVPSVAVEAVGVVVEGGGRAGFGVVVAAVGLPGVRWGMLFGRSKS